MDIHAHPFSVTERTHLTLFQDATFVSKLPPILCLFPSYHDLQGVAVQKNKNTFIATKFGIVKYSCADKRELDDFFVREMLFKYRLPGSIKKSFYDLFVGQQYAEEILTYIEFQSILDTF
jgi:hypothetical protein